ncbi:MAG TPA: hypothetical protein VMF09_06190 [Solirubrobacteraceae bacterium]|nr:hypothetical protein [Solirubrobacteraceae bacterium]
MRTAAVGATCALVGAAAGIAGSSASTTHATKKRVVHGAARKQAFKAGVAMGPGFAMAVTAGAAGPPVHSESVVPNEKGGFETVTMDRGTFSSLSGEQLTINEGTKSATYKTVTLTIPSDATVYRNGEKAALSDIKSGDTVTVVQSPSGTAVNAFDAEHEPKLQIHKAIGGPGPVTKQAGGGPLPPGAPEGPPGAGSEASESTGGNPSS